MKVIIVIKGWLARILKKKPVEPWPPPPQVRIKKGVSFSRDSKVAQFEISALAALEWMAKERHYLSSDDIWEYLESMGASYSPEPRAMGAAFRKFQAEGKIYPSNWTKTSRRKTNHGRSIRVWVSNMWEGNT